MLNVTELNVYYGDSHVLRDLSLDLAPGESLAIMGRNGMGKTTLLRSLAGMLPTRSGSITLAGQELTGSKSYERVAAGIGFVPQGRMIFPYLSVEENILTGMQGAPAAPVPDYIFEYFPVLFEMRRRKGGNLSGGQQQQLAIARALVSNPKVLILDEPTEGIQPSVIKEIGAVIKKLAARGDMAILLVEQFYDFAAELADQYLVMSRGEIVQQGRGETMEADGVRGLVAI